MKNKRILVCEIDHGHRVENGKATHIPTHFEQNAIVELQNTDADGNACVYHIGEDAEFIVPADALSEIDLLKTGKGHCKKICNLCHVLKPIDDFEVNQTDAQGGKTRRPSCIDCRDNIDKRPMSNAAKRIAEKHRPKTGSLWRCPICLKRSIVGVTAKVVLDHNHAKGTPRDYICDSCNTGLGRFQNGKNILNNAIKYVKFHEEKER